MTGLNDGWKGGAVVIAQDADAMREWCWEQNRWARKVGMARWYYVAKRDTGKLSVETKDGMVSEEVWKTLGGWFPDYRGWEPERLSKEFGLLRFFARQGMPRHEFEQVRFAA